jgi:hypothetical protein
VRNVVIAVAMFVLGAATVHAQGGINLSWDDCGALGAANRSFACDTNADSSVIVGSYRTGLPDLPCYLGMNCWIDLQVESASLPNWWQFKNPGSCRQQSLRVSAAFPYPALNCGDPSLGCGVGGIYQYNVGVGGPNRAGIIGSVRIPSTWCIPVVGNYAFMLIIRHDRTVGTGACDGCAVGACIVLNTVLVYNNATPTLVAISDPLQRNFITWQGGTGDCPGATPAINRTRGALKSAYR